MRVVVYYNYLDLNQNWITAISSFYFSEYNIHTCNSCIMHKAKRLIFIWKYNVQSIVITGIKRKEDPIYIPVNYGGVMPETISGIFNQN